MTERWHGTTGGYTNHKCRCDACREAVRVYANSYNHRTGRHRPRDIVNAERRAAAVARDNHGTESRYKLGCRCDACKAATNAARRRRRQMPNVKVHNRCGYANGCRCDVCREAHRVYSAERRAARAAA